MVSKQNDQKFMEINKQTNKQWNERNDRTNERSKQKGSPAHFENGTLSLLQLVQCDDHENYSKGNI